MKNEIWIWAALGLAACSSGALDLITSHGNEPCQVCGNECVRLSESPQHCGACGVVCKKGEACCGGFCSNLDNDTLNCGACGVTCSLTAVCMARKCACPPPATPMPMAMPMPCADSCAGAPACE